MTSTLDEPGASHVNSYTNGHGVVTQAGSLDDTPTRSGYIKASADHVVPIPSLPEMVVAPSNNREVHSVGMEAGMVHPGSEVDPGTPARTNSSKRPSCDQYDGEHLSPVPRDVEHVIEEDAKLPAELPTPQPQFVVAPPHSLGNEVFMDEPYEDYRRESVSSFEDAHHRSSGLSSPFHAYDQPTVGTMDTSHESSDDEDDDDTHNGGGDQFPSVQNFGSRRFSREPPCRSVERQQESRHVLTDEDRQVCLRLDEEYERALEEREVGWNARYNSVRQSACFAVVFTTGYLLAGTFFFERHTDWALGESLLFSIYTVTTVGYGNHEIPREVGVHVFIVFYILIGIATLTILVAQVYQCIALEASRAQFSRDKAELARRGNDLMRGVDSEMGRQGQHESHSFRADALRVLAEWTSGVRSSRAWWDALIDGLLPLFEGVKLFLRGTTVGRGISVVLPFAGLIIVGAMVVGPIEGWSFVESIYFAVVSLTTVGFGDYHPTKTLSIWFCVFWLPFSVGFMSLYLGSVAHFYIQVSNNNIRRLERRMRKRLRRAKAAVERDMAEARIRAARAAGEQLSFETLAASTPQRSLQSLPMEIRTRSQGFAELPTGDADDKEEGGKPVLFGSKEAAEKLGSKHRSEVIKNSRRATGEGHGVESAAGGKLSKQFTNMKGVLATVKREYAHEISLRSESGFRKGGRDYEFMSARGTSRLSADKRRIVKKPSFALRVLVQERLAEIIANEIAGYQSHVDIKENTLSVTIDTLKMTADKWMVPRRARKAFRSVSFEALYFVGERELITKGADALFNLTPFEFHGLCAPFLAAMGDADTMEGWLASTNILAEVDLRRDRAGLVRTMSGVSSRVLGAGLRQQLEEQSPTEKSMTPPSTPPPEKEL